MRQAVTVCEMAFCLSYWSVDVGQTSSEASSNGV